MKKQAADGIVIVKKYANRRLYNTETSSYITLDHLAAMIRAGRDFKVVDAKTDESQLRKLLEDHFKWTGSQRARALLDQWDSARLKFVKVFPNEY